MKLKVIFFDNGNTACFDEKDNQVSELQTSWLILYAEFLKKNNIDPIKVEFVMPNGRSAKTFSTDSGYNWRIL